MKHIHVTGEEPEELDLRIARYQHQFAPYRADPILLLALCIWREARGEPYAAKLGVAWVVRNRCTLAPQEGFKHTLVDNILKPFAFSSFNTGDPNSIKFPEDGDLNWLDSIVAAESLEADPTMGACFYYSPPLTSAPMAWGKVTHSATLGVLQFYRLSH